MSERVGVDRWVAAGEAAQAHSVAAASAATGVGGAGRRDRVVAVRLFAGELVAWQEAAVRGGRREVGRWVREMVNAAVAGGDAVAVKPAAVVRPGVELAQLARIGNNLNQAMRYANTVPGDSVAAQELADAVDRAGAEIRALRKAL